MSRRIELDLERSRDAYAIAAQPLAAAVPDVELETPPLPRDLPQWARDAVAISLRARELLGRLKPVIVTVLTFWDHRIRSVSVGGKTVSVDPSGSYRAE